MTAPATMTANRNGLHSLLAADEQLRIIARLVAPSPEDPGLALESLDPEQFDRGELRLCAQRIKDGHDPVAVVADASPATQEAIWQCDPDRPASVTPSRYRMHLASEALEPIAPRGYVVVGLLRRGDVAVLCGEAGSKKTFIALDMAVCVAVGKPWLQFATQQGTALIIDEESGECRLRDRLSRTMRGHGAGPDTPIAYTALERFDLRSEEDVGHVEELIGQTRPALVVIDAMADIMPGADENAVKDVQPVFRGLRGLADKYDAAILIIHHTNRSGSYRGSTAIKGAVDLMLMVESKPDSLNIHFKTEKARDIEPVTFAAYANFNPLTDTFSLRPSQLTKETKKKMSRSKAYVLRYLRDHGPSLITDITAHSDPCTTGAVRQATYDLANEGVTRRCDTGGPGEKATYELVPGKWESRI